MRWRYGDTNPVIAAVAAATVIEIGDLLWQDTDNAKPASLLPDSGNKAADQAAFTAKFLGVAMARSRPGDTAPIRVATTGVFEFDCAARDVRAGRPAGRGRGAPALRPLEPAGDQGGRQREAIGRVAKRQPVPRPACWSTSARP